MAHKDEPIIPQAVAIHHNLTETHKPPEVVQGNEEEILFTNKDLIILYS